MRNDLCHGTTQFDILTLCHEKMVQQRFNGLLVPFIESIGKLLAE